jgi:hypothetical protein
MPALKNLGGGGDPLFAKDMGVSANQFFRKFTGNGLKVKGSALLCKLGVEDNMEKDIPQFLAEGMVVPFIDRLQ